MKKTTQTRPFFVRFLEEEELSRAAGGAPNGNAADAADAAFANNPNAGLIAVTQKMGPCGNDCDHPDSGDDILLS